MDENEQWKQDLQQARDKITPWVRRNLIPMEEISSWDRENEVWRDDDELIVLKDEIMEEFSDQFDEELIEEIAEELVASDGDWGRSKQAHD